MTGIAFVLQVLLLVPEWSEQGAGELSTLSPLPSEIAWSGGWLVFWFAVLWLVFSISAWLKRRRERARQARI